MRKHSDSSKSYVTLDKEMSTYTCFVLRLEEKKSLNVSDKTSFIGKVSKYSIHICQIESY
jgi:hypothetical protein